MLGFSILKRLIGLPGDHIEIYDGFIKINGIQTVQTNTELQEQIVKLAIKDTVFSYKERIGDKLFDVQRIPMLSRSHKLSFIVPKDKYFFMGDNRDNSADSRSWGFVPRGHIKGRVTNVTMSVAFKNFIPDIKLSRFGKELI